MGRVIILLAVVICVAVILRVVGTLLKALRAGDPRARQPGGDQSSFQGGRSRAAPPGAKGADLDDRDHHYREVLGVSMQAGEQEIKAAYRALLAKYHPDKVTHLGGEFSELAAVRTREIIEAYDYLKTERGFN